ncbi:hypothetical protein GGQ85_002247 [Nitrobacter vulgaris]|nr:hypothetical protein [Nitrobacter vulgaris]
MVIGSTGISTATVDKDFPYEQTAVRGRTRRGLRLRITT